MKIFLALALALVACDPVGTIHGTVVEAPTKTPLADADVATNCGSHVKTDAQGHYETKRVGFLDPQCGVEVSKDGYAPVRATMGDRCEGPDKEHCRHARIDVELTPKP